MLGLLPPSMGIHPSSRVKAVHVLSYATFVSKVVVSGGVWLLLMLIASRAGLADQPWWNHNVELVGSLNLDGGAINVVVQDRRAYVLTVGPDGGSGHLHIIDVSDPTQPTELGVWPSSERIFPDLQVAGPHAYVHDGDYFKIIDASDPQAPRELFNHQFTFDQFVVDGSRVYLGRGSGIRILDISDPQGILVLSNIDRNAGPALGASGNLVLFGDDLYDVSDPADPRFLSRLLAPSFVHFVRRSAIFSESLIFVLGDWRMTIFEISDPTNPQYLRQYKSPIRGDDPGVRQSGLALDGSIAYMADGTWGMSVMDISDLDSPDYLRGTYVTPSEPTGVAVDDSLIYVTDLDAGLLILRYTGPVPERNAIGNGENWLRAK